MPKLTSLETLYVIACFFLPAIIVGRLFHSAGIGVATFIINQVLLITIGAGIIFKTSEDVHDKVLWILPLVLGLALVCVGFAIVQLR